MCVLAVYRMVIRRSLTKMTTLEQKAKGSEGASQLDYPEKDYSR